MSLDVNHFGWFNYGKYPILISEILCCYLGQQWINANESWLKLSASFPRTQGTKHQSKLRNPKCLMRHTLFFMSTLFDVYPIYFSLYDFTSMSLNPFSELKFIIHRFTIWAGNCFRPWWVTDWVSKWLVYARGGQTYAKVTSDDEKHLIFCFWRQFSEVNIWEYQKYPSPLGGEEWPTGFEIMGCGEQAGKEGGRKVEANPHR